jgi:hypothetical protein
MALLVPTICLGQDPPLKRAQSTLRFTEKRIAVLPIQDWRNVDPALLFFVEENQSTINRNEVHKSVKNARISLEKDPRFHGVGPDEIREFFQQDSSHATAVSLVHERYHLGIDLYDALRLKDAIKHLEEAQKHAASLYLEILDPQLTARIALSLGLSYLEENQPGKAHVSFKKMFLLSPQRKFRKGYYPTDTENALQAALVDALSSPEPNWPMAPSTLHALMNRLPVRESMMLILYDDRMEWIATDMVRTWRDREPLTEARTPDESSSRLISRWITCLQGQVARSRFANYDPEFRLDSNLNHGLFLKQPNRRMTQQVGVSTNGTFRFNRYLDGSIKLAISSLLQDPLQDLQGDVTGFRTLFSSGFSFRHNPMFWFIRTGIDLHYLDSFTVLTNPDCKFFGVESYRCAEGSATESKAAFLAGLALILGGAVDLSEDIYISLHSGLSLYKNLSGDATEFNYLLSNELGLGYRFH